VEQRDEEPSEDDDEGIIQRDGRRTLHLIGIKKGSATYAVAAPEHEIASRLLTEVGRFIEKPADVEWSESSLSALKDLSEVAKSMGCEIELLGPNGAPSCQTLLARVTADTYTGIASSAFIHAFTSVYARIERVGGATEMHCGIRLAESPRKMVIAHVKEADLVRELGQYLYQDVLLSGRATWIKKNWRLKGLIIESFEPPKTGSVFEALRSAHDAGGHAWNSVDDPDAYIAEMRQQ
jgi:hypothetical protein